MSELNTLLEDREWYVIGDCIGIDWAADAAIATGLKPEHFADAVAAALYRVIAERRCQGLPIDGANLAEADFALSEPQQERLVTKVNEIRFEARSGTEAAYNAAQVVRRGLDRLHTESVRRMLEDKQRGLAWDEAEASHSKRLNDLTTCHSNGFKSFADSVEPLLSELDEAAENRLGISTGFRDLDKIIGGLQPGRLIVPAAPSGGGKSAFSLNIGTHVARHGGLVGIISAEMKLTELHRRVACSVASVDSMAIVQRRLTPEVRARYVAAVEQASTWPFAVVDDNRNLATLVPRLRSKHRQQPFALIIADYVQLLRTLANRGDSREQQVAAIANTLKELAMQLDVPVLAPAQFNKQAETRGDAGPQLSDLRESSAIGHTADCVLFIQPPADGDTAAEIIVRKNRGGPKDVKVLLDWRPEYTRFENRSFDLGNL